jgi:hypothetical protein
VGNKMDDLSIQYDFGHTDLKLINDFERKMKISLPDNYVKLLTKHNGVKFLNNSFHYDDIDEGGEESSISFCCFGNVSSTNIDDFQDFDIYGYENIVTFGLNGGGDYIAFDYRQNPESDNPSVIIMYHDDFIEDENGYKKMRVVKVADSFDDFLNLLHE